MKTQNGRKINTQVSAERRGRPVPAIFVELWELRRTLRVFRSDFCVAPCGRGRLFAEARGAGRGRSEFSGAGWGRAPKFSRAGVFDVSRAVSGVFAIVGSALTAPHNILLPETPAENEIKIAFFLRYWRGVVRLCLLRFQLSEKNSPDLPRQLGQKKSVQPVPQRARPEGL